MNGQGQKWLVSLFGGLVGAVMMLGFLLTTPGSQQSGHHQAQAHMIDLIQQDARRTAPFTGHPTISEPIINVLQEVPRHKFVPAAMEGFAYLNKPLPIGHQQTISQPFVVALMTDIAKPGRSDIALEIGTGSGYQAAVLSRLVSEVHSVEVIAELAADARQTLQQQGYDNVSVYHADGNHGWPNAAPYDVILVTAAIEKVPPALIEQLAPGGRLVIPLGRPDEGQELMLISKQADGTLQSSAILPVRFVPFVGADSD